jgi:DNA-binding MarR family transcriptional regulator
MVEPLQPRREKSLCSLTQRAGASEPLPSVREVAAVAGVRSSRTAHHLKKLEEDGYVSREMPGEDDLAHLEKLAGRRADGADGQNRRGARARGRRDG